MRKVSTLSVVRFVAIIALMLAQLLSATLVFAQDEEVPPGLLRAAQAPGRGSLPNKAKVGRGRFATVDTAQLQQSQIQLNLLDGTTLLAVNDRIVANVDGNYVWLGHIDGDQLSQVTLALRNGVMAGHVLHGHSRYEIINVEGGTYAVYELDESLLPPHRDPIAVDAAALDTVEPGAAPQLDPLVAAAGSVIDLLVLYTPASRTRYGQASLESQIVAAVNSANQAYINSNVNMQLNIVRMEEISYSETGDMSISLSDLQKTTDGKMDSAHTLRNTYGADLVTLISEDTNACGIAYVMQSVGSSFASWAFNVVYSSCLSNFTLAHEHGHNEGNAHDRANASVTGAYPYSFGYQRCATDGTGFRTVMAYACSSGGATRINFFANPNVTYNGFATGISYEIDPANSADTARSMNNTATTVAAFRASAATTPPAAPTGLTANAASSTQINLAWTDAASDETGFKIERSLNNSTWTEIASVGSNVTTYNNSGLSANTLYYYRVRAYNGAGNSAYSNTASATTLAPSVITLNATARITSRKKYVDLVWNGAASANVDIYRNNTLVVTTPNDGTHTDTIGGKTKTFTYKVCEAGTTVCSGNVTVTFP